MPSPIPTPIRTPRGGDCTLLAASARFLIWATRNARHAEPAREAVDRANAGNPASCN